MRKLILIPIFFLMCGVCFGAERQNFTVDKDWTPKDSKYFMCNFFSKTPKTVLFKVKNTEFEMCNFYGCEIDETNTLKRSNLIDTTPPPVYTVEQLKIMKAQLESDLATSNKEIPKEELQEWVEKLQRIKDEEAAIND